MSLKPKGLDYLIQRYRRDDPVLAQILEGLNDQEQKLIDQGNLDERVLTNFEYRFELPGVLVVTNDIYPVWKRVSFPLDPSNNTIGVGQQITRIDVNAKVPSAAGPCVIDLLVTKDKGISFQSLLAAQKLTLPQGLNWIKYGGKFALAADILQDGWWFRVDVLTADGMVEAVEVIIRGVLIL